MSQIVVKEKSGTIMTVFAIISVPQVLHVFTVMKNERGRKKHEVVYFLTAVAVHRLHDTNPHAHQLMVSFPNFF